MIIDQTANNHTILISDSLINYGYYRIAFIQNVVKMVKANNQNIVNVGSSVNFTPKYKEPS